MIHALIHVRVYTRTNAHTAAVCTAAACRLFGFKVSQMKLVRGSEKKNPPIEREAIRPFSFPRIRVLCTYSERGVISVRVPTVVFYFLSSVVMHGISFVYTAAVGPRIMRTVKSARHNGHWNIITLCAL